MPDGEAERVMSDSQPITVERWASFDEANDLPLSIDTMGGFVDGHSWDAYVEEVGAQGGVSVPHLEALRKHVVEHGIKRGGDWHQVEGCPVFSDGTAASFSYRAWGDFCAAAYNTHEQTDRYGYMSFYMDMLVEERSAS